MKDLIPDARLEDALTLCNKPSRVWTIADCAFACTLLPGLIAEVRELRSKLFGMQSSPFAQVDTGLPQRIDAAIRAARKEQDAPQSK